VGRVKVDGRVTTKEAFARPKYKMIIAGSRREGREEEKTCEARTERGGTFSQ